MGEDRTTMCADKISNEVIAPPLCRHRHSSVISSCSEDAESESTSAGYPPTPDEEREEELEYGPGIVNKLKTRYLSIALKQTRGSNMRRSCSMENLLDQDRPPSSLISCPAEKTNGVRDSVQKVQPSWGILKRAKSMDTLLMELHPDQSLCPDINGMEDKRIPRMIKRREGCLTRLVPTICDEELPKPDTVKTYKRMFEPAESRRGYHSRRPPVLRASARSCAALKVNGTPTSSCAKVITRNKFSAKQSPPLKVAQSPVPDPVPLINGIGKKTVVNGDTSKIVYNGSHVVKATPVKITNNNNIRNGKDVEKNLNSINNFLNKKEVHFLPQTDIIYNGKGSHKEILNGSHQDISKTDIVKQFHKTVTTNGIANSKPKVPPNRPTLRSPKPLSRFEENSLLNYPKQGDANSIQKLKPCFTNGLKRNFSSEKVNGCISPDSNKVSELDSKFRSDLPKFPSEVKLREKIVLSPVNKSKDVISLPVDNEVKFNKSLVSENKTLKNSTVLSPESKSNIGSSLPVKIETGMSPEIKPIAESKLKPENKLKDIINAFTKPEANEESKPEALESTPTIQTSELHKPENSFKPLSSSTPERKIINESTAVEHEQIIHQDTKNVTPSPIVNKDKPSKQKPAPPPIDKDRPKKQKIETSDKIIKLKSESPTVDKDKSKAQNKVVDIKKPVKKSSASSSTSMVFDFRGKNVVSHVALLPTPFGCKALHPKKRVVDGKEVANGTDDEDEDYVDYSVPPPCGVVFVGENVKIGRGSILATRNKDLKISFHDEVDSNTFIYPSETSLLDDSPPEQPSSSSSSSTTNEIIPDGQPPPSSKLKLNTPLGTSSEGVGGLSTYTPSVLRTMDNFEPGMFRTPPVLPQEKQEKEQEHRKEEEEENQEDVRRDKEDEDLKPADPSLISSWSLSAGTSDLLF